MDQEVSAVPLSHDPRGLLDDPLLDSLLTLCQLHQKPASRAMLTSGLPLPGQRQAAGEHGAAGRFLVQLTERQQAVQQRVVEQTARIVA